MDRRWDRIGAWDSISILSTNLTVGVDDMLQTSQTVLRTAVTPINADGSITITRTPVNHENRYYFYLYFCEVQKLQPNQTRKFDIKLNGVMINDSPIVPAYISPMTIYDTTAKSTHLFNYTMEPTADSTLPPILTALEIFLVRDFLQSETEQTDDSYIIHYRSLLYFISIALRNLLTRKRYKCEK